ncbi:MAG: VWA domain-containing protein [Promethearchaeota archaeon]
MSTEKFVHNNAKVEEIESKKTALARWRLILGKKAEDHAINFSSPEHSDFAPPQNMDKTGHSSNASNKGQPKQCNKPGGFGQKMMTKTQQMAGKAYSKGSQIAGGKTSKVNQKDYRKGKDEVVEESGRYKKPNEEVTLNPKQFEQIDNTLNLVYNTNDRKRGAGLEASRLSIPKWIENVNKFFPKETKQVLEKDLVERSDLKDIIRNPELFEKVEPNLEMVKTILSLKDMLPENIKSVARKIVKKVVEDLKGKFKSEVEKHLIGAIKRDTHTPIKVFRNIDWKQSIRRNLKHYNPIVKKLIMAEPRFFSAEKRKKPWQIVVLVDESGSMTDSVIYSVVMASIFATLPSVHTNLLIFDTQVVDLSKKVDDPVDVLMSVQLGGGTDITKAIRYGQTLIKNPKKALMVIISDFYEGRPYNDLTNALKQVLEGQTKILGIASLGSNSEPMYDRNYAREMNKMGIDVLACTPINLPKIIAHLMR